MHLAPGRRRRRRADRDRARTATSRSGASCAACHGCSAARTCATPPSSSCRRARSAWTPAGPSASTPTATRRRAARHDPRVPRALRVPGPMTLLGLEGRRRPRRSARSRAARAGARGHEPARPAAAAPGAARDRELSGRLPGGSSIICATNGKTTTAAMVASILERAGTRLVHNRAGANMAGGVATALLDASRERRPGAVRGRRVLARPRRRRAAAAGDAAGEPLPRPARPLRRAGDDRRPLGAVVAASPPDGARAQRRRPARRGPGPRARRRPVLRRRRRLGRAGGHGARVGLQALPALRRALRLRRRLPRPPRPLPLPALRRPAPDPRSPPTRVVLDGMRGARHDAGACPAGRPTP